MHLFRYLELIMVLAMERNKTANCRFKTKLSTNKYKRLHLINKPCIETISWEINKILQYGISCRQSVTMTMVICAI